MFAKKVEKHSLWLTIWNFQIILIINSTLAIIKMTQTSLILALNARIIIITLIEIEAKKIRILSRLATQFIGETHETMVLLLK